MKTVKLSTNTLIANRDKMDAIDFYNKKLQLIRKRQLGETLKESTEIRVELMRSIRKWIGMMETRIFNDATIAEMDFDKVLSLFKHITKYSLEMLSQINDIEGLFKAYTESSNVSGPVQQIPQKNDETTELKKTLLKSLMESMKKTADNAIIKTEEMSADNQSGEIIDVMPIEDAPLETKIDEIKPTEIGEIENLPETKDETRPNA